MVNKEMNEQNKDIDMEIANEEIIDNEEPDLIEIEEKSDGKIKKMRDRLHEVEAEKKELQDSLQRERADFLNARKRIEDERERDRTRAKKNHVEELLPLCDSFQMAMSDKTAWEKADTAWRKGVEGIHGQLLQILESYQVSIINPEGEEFNPRLHEAVDTEEVADKKQLDKVLKVLQSGYEMKVGSETEIVRPARVTIGVSKE